MRVMCCSFPVPIRPVPRYKTVTWVRIGTGAMLLK
jgi:hypothetical protein